MFKKQFINPLKQIILKHVYIVAKYAIQSREPIVMVGLTRFTHIGLLQEPLEVYIVYYLKMLM